MERIYTLIDKLSQQKVQGASPAHLLFTVQLLQHELLQLQKPHVAPGTRKVAVTLPFHSVVSHPAELLEIPPVEVQKVVEVVEKIVYVEKPVIVEKQVIVEKEVIVEKPVLEIKPVEEVVEEKEIYVLDMSVEEEEEISPSAPEETVQEQQQYILRKPVVQEMLFEEPKPVVKEEPRPSYTAQQLFNSAFDTAVEVPTLAQYKSTATATATATAEVHEKIAQKKESLNDLLKQEKQEVATLLKETPIKDLRKGIGINDRFAFVRELFRGDDAAYERSIKTINGFNIYSEAEYWMSRELKLKLGWDEKSETVQYFYQLVRRRFS